MPLSISHNKDREAHEGGRKRTKEKDTVKEKVLRLGQWFELRILSVTKSRAVDERVRDVREKVKRLFTVGFGPQPQYATQEVGAAA